MNKSLQIIKVYTEKLHFHIASQNSLFKHVHY